MGDQRVLVAFASRTGSTAGIADAIADVLRLAGFAVDCLPAGDVADVGPYAAVVLGSGVFVPLRRSDGGGFLARHEAALATRSVWLYSAGPIGRGRCAAGTAATDPADCSVTAVARAIRARGAAVFGPLGPVVDAEPALDGGLANQERIRAWAAGIAAELAPRPRRARSGRHGGTGCRHLAATGS